MIEVFSFFFCFLVDFYFSMICFLVIKIYNNKFGIDGVIGIGFF